MGQGFFIESDNKSGVAFKGSEIKVNCIDSVANLHEVPRGFYRKYIEYRRSGSCWFETNFVVEGYTLPNTPPNEYVYAILLGERNFTAKPPWASQQMSFGRYKCQVYTLQTGVPVTLESIKQCDDQVCMFYKIGSGGQGVSAQFDFAFFDEESPDDRADQGPSE